jgi:hypothetical protein
MKKYYINIDDYQGGNWAMGSIDTIKNWKQRALEWCDSDENWELYKYIKRHKLDTDLIKIINDYWDINIVEFNYENIQKILDNYDRENYYWLLQDIIYKLEKGEWK